MISSPFQAVAATRRRPSFAANCATSVEPCMATVVDWPPEIAIATASK
jgi:hypothetical protein